MRLLVLALITVLLSACAGLARVPEDRFYRLATPEPAHHLDWPAVTRSVVVQPLEADGLYTERAIIFSEDPGHRVLQQYHYHFWLDAPGRLLQDYVAAYLRASGLAGRVSAEYSGAPADYVVSGRVRRFERLLDGEGGQVVVALQLRLLPPDSDSPLVAGQYQAAKPDGGSLAGSVEAFERALDSILAEFVGDVQRATEAQTMSSARGPGS